MEHKLGERGFSILESAIPCDTEFNTLANAPGDSAKTMRQGCQHCHSNQWRREQEAQKSGHDRMFLLLNPENPSADSDPSPEDTQFNKAIMDMIVRGTSMIKKFSNDHLVEPRAESTRCSYKN